MLTAPPNQRAAASPTATPTDTPTASGSPSSTDASTATPTPEASPALTAAASTGAASSATTCTGTTQFTDLFAEAASQEPFDVYCAVLPPDYWIHDGNYSLPDGGNVRVEYENARGFHLVLEEGNLCPAGPTGCESAVASSGPIWLGDLRADLYDTTRSVGDADPTEVYLALVYAGTGRVYGLTGYGMSAGTFVNLAAAVVKVSAP